MSCTSQEGSRSGRRMPGPHQNRTLYGTSEYPAEAPVPTQTTTLPHP